MAAILALVAINTLLFLGLSIAKVAPWPEPLHPRILRERVGRTASAELAGSHQSGTQTTVRQGLLLQLVTGLHRVTETQR